MTQKAEMTLDLEIFCEENSKLRQDILDLKDKNATWAAVSQLQLDNLSTTNIATFAFVLVRLLQQNRDHVL